MTFAKIEKCYEEPQLTLKQYTKNKRFDALVEPTARKVMPESVRVIAPCYIPGNGIMYCDIAKGTDYREVMSISTTLRNPASAPATVFNFFPFIGEFVDSVAQLVEEGISYGYKVYVVLTNHGGRLYLRGKAKPYFNKGVTTFMGLLIYEKFIEKYDESQVFLLMPTLQTVKSCYGLSGKNRDFMIETCQTVLGLKKEEVFSPMEENNGKIEFETETGKKFYVDPEDLTDEEAAGKKKINRKDMVSYNSLLKWSDLIFDKIDYLNCSAKSFKKNFVILGALLYGIQVAEGSRIYMRNQEIIQVVKQRTAAVYKSLERRGKKNGE